MATLRNLTAKTDRISDAATRAFQERMDATLKKLNNKIINMLEQYKQDNKTDMVDLRFSLQARAQIEAALIDSGYYEVTDQFLANYGDVLKSVTDRFALFDYKMKVTTPDATVIKNLMGFDADYFNELGRNVTNELYRAIYENTIVPQPFENIVSQVRATIENSDLKRYAYTYANDTIQRFGRNVGNTIAEKTGWKKVLYQGPEDDVTRDFCREHVNEVMTKDEAMALKNDFGNSAWTDGGGYNCRHQWVAVPDDYEGGN
jgi:hypothetical protein